MAVGVELAAELLQLADAVGGLVGEHHGGGALGEAAAGLERVLEVDRGRVVDRERRGRAALGPVGGGLGERAGADEGHARALARGGQGGEESGRAGADDDEVGSHGPEAITVCAMEESSRRAIWLRDDDFMAHDVPGSPGAAGADPGAGGGDERERLVRRCRGCRRSRSSVRVLLPVHPEEHVAFLEELCAAGRRGDRRRHLRRPGDVRRRRCGPRAVRCSWSTRCWAARRDVGVSALRPPGHHAEAARAMGFCFFGNAAVAARRATAAHGLVAGDDRRLGRPPRQRDQRHLPRATPTCCSSRSTSGRCIRGRARRPTWAPARGEGYTVNLPVPGGSGRRRVPVAGRARRVRADPHVGAGARADLGRVRRAPRRPARDLPRDRGGVRGDGGVAAPGRRRRAARRWAWCWRAATTSARWPLDGRGHAGAGGRVDAGADAAAVDVHPLARDARRRGWRGGGRPRRAYVLICWTYASGKSARTASRSASASLLRRVVAA